MPRGLRGLRGTMFRRNVLSGRSQMVLRGNFLILVTFKSGQKCSVLTLAILFFLLHNEPVGLSNSPSARETGSLRSNRRGRICGHQRPWAGKGRPSKELLVTLSNNSRLRNRSSFPASKELGDYAAFCSMGTMHCEFAQRLKTGRIATESNVLAALKTSLRNRWLRR